jgi:hypothetical protein
VRTRSVQIWKETAFVPKIRVVLNGLFTTKSPDNHASKDALCRDNKTIFDQSRRFACDFFDGDRDDKSRLIC